MKLTRLGLHLDLAVQSLHCWELNMAQYNILILLDLLGDQPCAYNHVGHMLMLRAYVGLLLHI